MPTIALVMIVKDERQIMQRCLASVVPIIDYWVICDTGSRDGTPDYIKATLAGIPGELHHCEWVNFGHNRSQCVALARGKADYLLLLDADMVVNMAPGFDKSQLKADAYEIGYTGDLHYYQRLMVSTRHHWRYIGVTHEYIHSETAKEFSRLKDLSITHLHDGSSRAEKFERDLRLLLQAHEDDREDVRTVFYIAQTYKDLGNADEALRWYARRIEMGGWAEEVWYSMYQSALLRQAMGRPWPMVMESYLKAYNYRPTRAEPLFHLALYYRTQMQYAVARIFTQAGVALPYPDDILFIDRTIYEYKLLMEHAICSYWLDDYAQSVAINERLLKVPGIPDDYRQHIVRNLALSREAMNKGP